MPFPDHIAKVLDAYGVDPAIKAILYDAYIGMGSLALEAFIQLSERSGGPNAIRAEELTEIRALAAELYLRAAHPRWLDHEATASFWHPAGLEGRASGLTLPLGSVGGSKGEDSDFCIRLDEEVRRIVGDTQPVPRGVLLLGRNAHFGGRHETVSFDIVPDDLDAALAVARAAGQQHTTPGAVGETSGTVDAGRKLALIWEVQPNVFKPAGERNREISKVWRKHRNWHVGTLVAAIQWMTDQGHAIYVLRGDALATAHEVNPEKPVAPQIVELHDRTVCDVVTSLGRTLEECSAEDEALLAESIVMNHALKVWSEEHGPASAMWRVGP